MNGAIRPAGHTQITRSQGYFQYPFEYKGEIDRYDVGSIPITGSSFCHRQEMRLPPSPFNVLLLVSERDEVARC